MTSTQAQGRRTEHETGFKIFVNRRNQEVSDDVLTYGEVVKFGVENPQTGPEGPLASTPTLNGLESRLSGFAWREWRGGPVV